MKRTAMMMAMAMLVSAGFATGQEPIDVPPASAPQGGKVVKAKTMTAVGAVKTVTADSLAINNGPGKDWTFVIDTTTKIILARTGNETIDVPPTSAPQGGKVIPTTPHLITDIKEGQRVQVKYHNVNGKMHATQVQVI